MTREELEHYAQLGTLNAHAPPRDYPARGLALICLSLFSMLKLMSLILKTLLLMKVDLALFQSLPLREAHLILNLFL